MSGSWRRWLVVPVVAVLSWWVADLALGRETLFLRDVLNTHLELKSAQAGELAAGRWGYVDPMRGGGQPLLGNPDAFPWYPDTLLFLVAPDLWAINAHFWIHLLIAPFAAAWLGRRLGLPPPAAWVAGAAYATSGYFLSLMSYANVIGVATVAPALAAAAVGAARGSRRDFFAVALLWPLSLLGGDPATAAVAAVAAAWSVAVVAVGEPHRAAAAVGRPLLAVGLGTAIALPQIVELLRVLPSSSRAVLGYGAGERVLGSFDPRGLVELLFPFAFGRIDRLAEGRFWGFEVHGGELPFFLVLAPGVVVFGLVVAAGKGGRVGLWSWPAVGLGAFLSLGRFNPLVDLALASEWASALRFPVKAWLLVALGSALLAGEGFRRTVSAGSETARRRFSWTVGGIALLSGSVAAAAALAPPPVLSLARAAIPETFPDAFVAAELWRWAGLCLAVSAVSVAAGLVVWGGRRRPSVSGAALVTLHVVSQLLLCGPAVATDDVRPYLREPPILEALGGRTRLVHGAVDGLFGAGPSRGIAGEVETDAGAELLARRAAAELFPFVGVRYGLSYELSLSPEGLGTFLGRLAADAVRSVDDAGKVRLIRSWGVEAILSPRPLRGVEPLAGLAARRSTPGGEVFLYPVRDPVPPIRLVTGVLWAEGPREALAHLLDPSFDPRATAILAGAGEDRPGGRGLVRVLEAGPESVEVETDSPVDAVLVVDAAHLPLFRATVDGEPARLSVANLHRMAVPVPGGRHRVRIEIDRAPTKAALAAAAVGALLVLVVGLRLPSEEGAGPG